MGNTPIFMISLYLYQISPDLYETSNFSSFKLKLLGYQPISPSCLVQLPTQNGSSRTLGTPKFFKSLYISAKSSWVTNHSRWWPQMAPLGHDISNLSSKLGHLNLSRFTQIELSYFCFKGHHGRYWVLCACINGPWAGNLQSQLIFHC